MILWKRIRLFFCPPVRFGTFFFALRLLHFFFFFFRAPRERTETIKMSKWWAKIVFFSKKIITARYVNLNAYVQSVSYIDAWAYVNYNVFFFITIVV